MTVELRWWEREEIPFSINVPTATAIERGKEFIKMMTELLDTAAQNQVRAVASDLIVNACDANWRVDGETIWISFQQVGDTATLVVEDQGQGFSGGWRPFQPDYWLNKEPPRPDAERGRGIFLAKSQCDSLEYRRTKSGMSAKATWKKADSMMKRSLEVILSD